MGISAKKHIFSEGQYGAKINLGASQISFAFNAIQISRQNSRLCLVLKSCCYQNNFCGPKWQIPAIWPGGEKLTGGKIGEFLENRQNFDGFDGKHSGNTGKIEQIQLISFEFFELHEIVKYLKNDQYLLYKTAKIEFFSGFRIRKCIPNFPS